MSLSSSQIRTLLLAMVVLKQRLIFPKMVLLKFVSQHEENINMIHGKIKTPCSKREQKHEYVSQR